MKNYSFSNIAGEESYATRKSNDFGNAYRHSELKGSEASLRIEEIKKKYDTPSRRQRIDSLKKSRDYELMRPLTRDDPKENVPRTNPPSYAHNPLKESFALNRLEKSSLRNDPDAKDFVNLRAERENRRNYDSRDSEMPAFRGSKEDEEALFSKVREMKESLINNDFMKSSIGARSSINGINLRNQPTQPPIELRSEIRREMDVRRDGDFRRDAENRRDFDPRVENIDKINSKIKQILNCLAENEKTPARFGREDTTTNFRELPSNNFRDSTTSNFRESTTNLPKESIVHFRERESSASNYFRDSSTSNYLRERESAGSSSAFLKENPSVNKESAFFGIKAREISESKKSYESHFQRNSDVLEKINVLDGKNPSSEAKETKEPKEATKVERDIYKVDKQSYKVDRDNYKLDKESYKVEKDSYKIDKEPAADKYGRFEQPYTRTTTEVQKEIQRIKDRDYSVNRIDYGRGDYSVSKPIKKREEELTRTPTYLNRYDESKNALKASRSRSQIDSIKKSTLGPNDDVLRSGKKLNDEISKIQRKIEEFEKEKRKLNIEFTPFSSKNKSTTNLLGVRPQRASETPNNVRDSEEPNETSKSIIDFKGSSHDFRLGYQGKNLNSEEKSVDNNREKEREQARQPREPYYRESAKSTNNYDNPNPRFGSADGDFQLKIQQVEVKTLRIDHPIEVNEEASLNETGQYNSGLKNEIDEGILERKKRLQGNDEIIKTDSLKKLVSLFCEQAKFDEQFRNLKIWLECNFQSDKFGKIVKLLEKEGESITTKQAQSIFTVDESEHNPFFTCQGFEGNFESLVKAYLQSKSHWQGRIKNKFERNALLGEGFTSSKIDLEKKNFIELEDLVRFLNIESGTFYRNRDIFLIFRRFTTGERTSFEGLLSEICA